MRFRIGAGTLVTVLLALAIGGYSLYQQRRATAQPPVVERVVQGTTQRGIAPVPEFMLRHRDELALNTAQVHRIQAIATAYRKDVAPYQQRMTAAAVEYQRRMERTQHGQRPNVQELQNAGGDVQRLSSIVVATRHAYWQQARAVLNEEQQSTIDHLVSKATLRDLQ